MNQLTIESGAYVLLRAWDGETVEGESQNLVAVFDVDTMTLIDGEYNRAIAILNCLYTDVELNGTVYGSSAELEQAYNDAIEKSQGGGSKVEVVDELPEVGEDGKFYVLSESKNVYLYTDSEGYIKIEDNTGSDIILLELSDYTGEIFYNGEAIGFDEVESLFEAHPGQVVMKARYMNATLILCPVYTINSFYFFADYTDETNLGVIVYVLDKGMSTVRTKLLTPEMLTNKVTTLDNADNETYPTTNAVKTYVDGKIWDGTEDELPAPEDQIEGVIYLVHE